MKQLLLILISFLFILGCSNIVKNPDGSVEYNYYYSNGTLKKQKVISKDSTGKEQEYWTFYYSNGSLKKEGITVNNKSQGLWKFYYEDGTLKSETE